jgi:hypothetical protein
VPRGYVGAGREVELAQPASRPPVPHQRAEGDGIWRAHTASLPNPGTGFHDVGGNCLAYLEV